MDTKLELEIPIQKFNIDKYNFITANSRNLDKKFIFFN